MSQIRRRQDQRDPWTDPAARPFVRIEKVTKTFGTTYAVDEVSLDIYRGEFFSLLGGSGCGKSTLLRMLAGLEMPDSGRILIDGIDVTRMPPYERPVNMMFQSYALFPHLSVEQNIAFGLKQDRLPKAQIRERVEQMLELVQLKGYGHRRPDQLSGGQRQRVALARALAKQPKLLLLDEPLGALDRKLREHTQFELMGIQERVGVTFVTVTHDQEEAMTMSSRVAVMDAGRIVQVNTPAALYEFPANRFVAGFIGAVNLLEGRVSAQHENLVEVACEGYPKPIRVQYREPLVEGQTVSIAVRPEKVEVHDEPPADALNWLSGRVTDIAYLGDVSIYHITLASGRVFQVQLTHVLRYERPHYQWEDEIVVSFGAEDAVLLSS